MSQPVKTRGPEGSIEKAHNSIDTANGSIALSRRNFLKAAGVTGGGLVLGVSLTGCLSQPALQTRADTLSPNAFLQISSDNVVRFYCPRDEMGQGITTGLATIIAEELDIHPQLIEVKLAGVLADYVNPGMGIQGTGASKSVREHYTQLRQAGADTRALLIHAAAQEKGVNPKDITTDNGAIIVDGARFQFGEFAEKAAKLSLDQQVLLKPSEQFKYIGTDFGRVDAVEKSTGTAMYGIDAELPGMRYAVVKHIPVAGASIKSVNEDSIKNMPGVLHIKTLPTGVGVVAERYWQAKKAAAALEVEWELPELANVNSAQIKSDYQAALSEGGEVGVEQGDLGQGFAAATTVVESEYWAPYLAHAPMEPMNALVRVGKDDAEVWSGTQMPQPMRGLVARHAGLSADKVTVHPVYMGGAFGRRSFMSHVIEATILAKETGEPIKVVWSRESDMQNGVYRPASLMTLKAGVDENGKISAWAAKRVGGNINPDMMRTMLPAVLPGLVPEGATNFVADIIESFNESWSIDSASIEGLCENYDFPNREARHVTVNHGLPLMFWRAVGHSFTAFAKEVMIDELAEQAKLDPVDFRIANTETNPRLQNVIRLAGERMKHLEVPAGHSLGFAAHGSFESDVAQVAQVSVDSGKIRVHKVVCVIDCGRAINPDIVKGQIEGSIMFGLTAALYGDIQLENGAVKESNFHNYPILRMNESPEVEVIIVKNDDAPTGAGEPGLPPIAPAVANAVYQATGQRLRSLPLTLA